MHLYEMHIKASKEQKAHRKAIQERVNKLTMSAVEKRITNYPDVCDYLTAKFPSIDISQIPIYEASASAFKRSKWENVGGLFIPWLSVILVKDSSDGTLVTKGKFEQELAKYRLAPSDIEDVVVHECLHAISSKAGRSSACYAHMEEEFVYTNCIEFYKNRGMTVDEIVENNFLPFCMQDVLSSRKDLNDILQSMFDSGVKKVDYWSLTSAERRKFENGCAVALVSEIVKKARNKGKHMVECYNKYGQGVSLPTGDLTDKSLRFASINMDCDI